MSRTKAYAAQLVDLHGLAVAVALVPLHTEARTASAPLVVASRPAPAGLTGWDLLGADPEVDLEHVGRKVPHVSRVYVTGSGSLPLTAPVRVDVETPRSPTKRTDSARAGMVPTKRLPLAALSQGGEKVYDVVHRDGAGYALLHRLADTLEQTGRVLELQGRNGLPLALRKGGRPHRVLLSGRRDGSRYSLRLHAVPC